MHNGLQQAFVTQHDGCASACFNPTVLAKPLAHIAGLDVLGGCCGEGDVLFLGEIVVDGFVVVVEFVGEQLQVLLDVVSAFVVTGHVVSVEIPIEQGFPGIFQSLEELLLNLLQHVEPHKDIDVVVELDVFVVGHLAIECAFVSQPLLGELLVVNGVDVVEMVPKLQEALFEDGVLLFREIAEELGQQRLLLFGEIIDVVHLVNVAQIGKHLVGISHVLVDVIKVGQQQLPPSIEMVECLVYACYRCEDSMQVADELDGVGNRKGAVLAEEVADGDIAGAPYGFVNQSCQLLVHEQRCTLVGEHNSHPRQICAELVDDVLCDVCQKRCIHFTSSILLLYTNHR